jgi:serine/threonine protein kinase
MVQQAWGPGSVVASRFRLEDLLDERAGARFWRATDTTLARNVAIHVLSAEDKRAQAVLTAARTSATVSEPHLLRVLDAVQEDDVVHVVHEWGSGVSLDRIVDEETLDPRRAAWLVREVAQAITATHAQGVAHGRLLPENVLITETGSVKLIGFVVDAVLYGRLSPEETRGAHLSEHENDVRNLGALLYAALTARWPGTPASVVPDAPLDHGQVCLPRQVRAGVPRELDSLCASLLRGSSSARTHHTAATVAEELGRFLGEDAPHAVTGLTARSAFLASEADAAAAYGGGDLEATQASPLAAPDADQATQASPLARPDTDGHDPFGHPPDDEDAEATRAVPVAGESRGAHPPGGDTGDTGDTAPPRPPWLGMGAGAAPPDWGPDYDDTGSLPAYEPPSENPGSNWLRLGAALAGLLLLALAAVVITGLGGPDLVPGGDGGSEETEAPSEPPRPVEIASVSDFDPEQDGGSPEENPDLVPLATDGDPDTAWTTSTYFDGPPLAPYKSGVGLLLDLGEEVEVADVVATLDGDGYGVQLLAAGEGAGPPSAADGVPVVAERTGAGGRVVLAPESPVTTRYLVLWLTALPSVGDGYQGSVAEVVVRS